MGLEMELNFKKSSTSDLSPNTVLPTRHCSQVEKRTAYQKPPRKDDVLRVKDGFTEISFRRYRSTSCKSVPSRPSGIAPSVELKRGSTYQSSREVRRMKKMESSCDGRRKIELSRGIGTSFSLDIVESLCSSDEEDSPKVHPSTALDAKLSLVSAQKSRVDPCSSAGFIEFCPNSDVRPRRDPETIESRLRFENPGLKSENVASPQNDGNGLLERDAPAFHKTLSATLEMPQSPSTSESDCSTRGSSKSRFVPIRKMFDPFMKSKSSRSPSSYVTGLSDHKANSMTAMRRNEMLRKSLLHDFSHTAQNDQNHSDVSCSAVYLHGCLKLRNKNKVPYFEFSLRSPEEILVAKTWKVSNASKWVYTFHSICSRKRSNASGRGTVDDNKESMVVGQMHVSSYLHSEPDLEIAAIVIQIPFAKRESLKFKRGYKSRKKVHLNLLNLSMTEQCAKQSPDRENSEKVKVVIPTGNHSMPSDTESKGPSSLLNRWRFGGGCDCGGWDMACPLTVFGNPEIQCSEDEPLVDKQQPLELFIQGTKERTPALIMKVVEEGEYAVDFHAKLSTVQAFSICVAMLHGSEAANAVGENRSKKKLPHCNSLKVLIEEEVKFLIDTVAEEEKKKPAKKMELKQQPYKLRPPISPFARV
ncbi:hypothetical protein LINPERPRIM_LOCUS8449 [Linum perenne]